MTNKIPTLKAVFERISKKPIFVCSPQDIAIAGKVYKGVPRCDYVQISWEDYNKLKELIDAL